MDLAESWFRGGICAVFSGALVSCHISKECTHPMQIAQPFSCSGELLQHIQKLLRIECRPKRA